MSDDEEKCSKVLWENHQWRVTDYGMESVRPGNPYYHFNAERLLERQGVGAGELYNWPIHMAQKDWVDARAFIEAFVKALDLHKGRFGEIVDGEVLKASLARAYKQGVRCVNLGSIRARAQSRLSD